MTSTICQGQCDSDFDFGSSTFSSQPAFGEAFSSGCLGSEYSDVWHILIPTSAADIDEQFPPTLPIDSMVVEPDGVLLTDTVTNETFLPAEIGLGLVYNNNGDSGNESSFIGGQQYCAVIQGTPNRAGMYRISIDVFVWATIFTPFNAPYTFEFLFDVLDANCQGCPDPLACNYDPSAVEDNGGCLYLDECGVCGGLFRGIPPGDCDCYGNEPDAIGVCAGSCVMDNDNNGVCDTEEVYGCTYALADNFNESATRDDGTCIFPCEGDVNANIFDWDGDYNVTVTDFLMMLSVYGDTDVDLDGIWDSSDVCMDLEACNYSAEPSEPCAYIDVLGVCGGGCEGDEDDDGICDDVDPALA